MRKKISRQKYMQQWFLPFIFFLYSEMKGSELEVDGWMNDKIGENEKMPLTKSSSSIKMPPQHTHTST